MLSVPQSYKEATNASFREFKSLAIISFDESVTIPFATATASSSASGYVPNQACDGRLFLSDEVGQGQHLPSSLGTMSKGWRGGTVSNSSGVINETLTVTYRNTISTKTLFLYTPEGMHPVDFKVYVDDVLIADVVNNDRNMWTYKFSKLTQVKKVRFTATRIASASAPLHVIEFGALHTVVLDDDLLVDFECVTETKPPDNGPVGGVSSNDISLSLNNEAGWFTQNSLNSLFSDTLNSNIFLRLFVALRLPDNTLEYLPWGEYEVSEWRAPNTTLEASVKAYDRLYRVGNLPAPVMPVIVNTNSNELILKLLTGVGIPSSMIQFDLNTAINIPNGWIIGDTVYKALNEICVVANVSIIATRDFKIRVMSNFLNNNPIDSWDDEDQIIELHSPVKNKDTYDGIKLTYSVPTLSGYTELADLGDIELLPGENKLNSIKLDNDHPVLEVGRVLLSDSSDVELLDAEFGALDANFTIQNNTAAIKNIGMSIYGKRLTLTEFTHRTSMTPGAKLYEITSQLVQNNTMASRVASAILPFVIGEHSTLSCTIRGNMAVELLDTVEVYSDTDSMRSDLLQIERIKLIYNGGIEMDIEGRSPKKETQYTYIGMGLVVQY